MAPTQYLRFATLQGPDCSGLRTHEGGPVKPQVKYNWSEQELLSHFHDDVLEKNP